MADPDRWQGFVKEGPTEGEGITHAIIYDVPQAPLVSIGQFQHAQLSRYQFEPSFVVGNSYANPRIPLGETSVNDFAGMSGLKIADTSYETNERLWDGYFFSTMAPDYKGNLGDPSGSYDSKLSFDDLADGNETLPNPRMVFRPRSGDKSFAEIISSGGDDAPEAIASRMRVSGAFNVNSTSVAAWKAFLSGMGASELPSIDPATGSVSWNSPDGVRFNRFGQTISPREFTGDTYDESFYQGWRELDDAQLTALANAVVDEIRKRGPFLSMADFVNRDPKGSGLEIQRKGALQAALDRVVNNSLDADIGNTAEVPAGSQFEKDAVGGENEAAGNASYLLQGDVLQSLAPAMQVRSDYFRIRAYGSAKDRNGNVVARAWCEALVQRSPEYGDPSDLPEIAADDLTSPQNRTFGRRFDVVGFRWLSRDEI